MVDRFAWAADELIPGDDLEDVEEETSVQEGHAVSEHVPLTEAMAGVGDMQAVGKGRYRVLLIRAGQGSSGYYYPEVLRRDGPKIFPAGTRMYMDHPTLTERAERPEGSTLNWASVTTTDPIWDPAEDGLVSEVEVFPHWRHVLNPEYAKHIGLSIRATGTVEAGEVDGRRTLIVTSLGEGTSVDWVTQAGAGGRVLQLIESARTTAPQEGAMPPFQKATDDEEPDDADVEDEDLDGDDDDKDPEKKDGKKLPAFLKAKESGLAEAATVGTWFESRIHLGFTEMADEMFGGGLLTRDERIGLSSAIGEALAAFNTRIEADHPHLYQRDLWADPARDTPPITDDTTITKGAPMTEGTTTEQAPPDRGAVTESARDTDLAAALAEARRAATALTEAQADAAQRIKALEEKLAQGDAERLRLDNDKDARAAVAEALKTSGLHALSHSRVTESVCRTLPTSEDGRLDAAKFSEAITTAIADERTYVASLAEAAGAGMPRGLGESLSASEPLTESAFETELTAQFERIGMTPAAAKIAAAGRR